MVLGSERSGGRSANLQAIVIARKSKRNWYGDSSGDRHLILRSLEECEASLGTMNRRTMNAAQDRRPEPDFCYLLRGNITPEPQSEYRV